MIFGSASRTCARQGWIGARMSLGDLSWACSMSIFSKRASEWRRRGLMHCSARAASVIEDRDRVA